MRLAYVGYTSLRRDLLAPTNGTDLFLTALIDLKKMTGNPVYFLPLKKLQPGCEIPPATCDPDEREGHRSVIHYGDALKPLTDHIGTLPVRNRYEALQASPFDWNTRCRYSIPEVDVVIVESSAQISSAYAITETLRQFYRVNPRVGYIVIDLDLAGGTTLAKMKKWHPNIWERMIYATYHPTHQKPNQVFLGIPHLEHRNCEPSLHGTDIAYVGNDYFRRESMLQLMQGPRFHWYGRVKPDFRGSMVAQGINLYGAFIPNTGEYTGVSVEDIYRRHGFGIYISRDDYYKTGLLSIRISEVPRAGVPMFCHSKMLTARPIVGDWCMVNSAHEIADKANTLILNPNARLEWINYQRQMAQHYLNRERYAHSLYYAAQRLMQGPLPATSNWKLSMYDDLLVNSGLRAWHS